MRTKFDLHPSSTPFRRAAADFEMELYTPCAGTRPGAADPKRSKAANPPPRPSKNDKVAE